MKREFMVERQGKNFVLYAGLLDEAHSKGLTAIKTSLIQIPSPENGNVAIAIAEVTLTAQEETALAGHTVRLDRVFTAVGDASPDNVARVMIPHLIRMAETRAKARALRDAINVGAVAIEELSSGSEFGNGDEAEPADLTQYAREKAAAEKKAAATPQQAAPVAQQAAPAAQQTAPAAQQTAPAAQPQRPAGGLATPAQVRALYSLARSHQIPDQTFKADIASRHGVPPEQLTKSQASAEIDALKKRHQP